MKQQIYKIKEFFKGLVTPYYKTRKEQDVLAARFSVLEKLAKKHGSIELVPIEEFEREAKITKTRNDLGDYIPCTY